MVKATPASQAHESETDRSQNHNSHSTNGERGSVDSENVLIDAFRWSRCKKIQPQTQMVSIGIPLPLEHVEVISSYSSFLLRNSQSMILRKKIKIKIGFLLIFKVVLHRFKKRSNLFAASLPEGRQPLDFGTCLSFVFLLYVNLGLFDLLYQGRFKRANGLKSY